MEYLPDAGRGLTDEQTKFVRNKIIIGEWKLERLSKSVTGLPRDCYIFRAERKSKGIKYAWHGDKTTVCPPRWADLAIGSGVCNYSCRFCFLCLTFRITRDPLCPLIYTNDFSTEVKRFLEKEFVGCSVVRYRHNPSTNRLKTTRVQSLRRPQILGIGVDCSDSLLYEGLLGHVRQLGKLFNDPSINKYGRKMLLLTKSTNWHYLRSVSPGKVVVSFSLNPEPVADLWEGKYPDTLERITPSIDDRLEAAAKTADLGFEVRWRIDPIIPTKNWKETYRRWFKDAAKDQRPHRITLGTYRQKNTQLDLWRKKWGIPPAEWYPERVTADGTHGHLLEGARVTIYKELKNYIEEAWAVPPQVGVCKESVRVLKRAGIERRTCNCLM